MQGNKVKYSATMSVEVWELVKKFERRFQMSRSSVIELCVLTCRDSLELCEQTILSSEESLNPISKLLGTLMRSPHAFDDVNKELRERQEEADRIGAMYGGRSVSEVPVLAKKSVRKKGKESKED